MRAASIACLCLVSAACARSATPQQAVASYARALERGDRAAAERVLSDDARRQNAGERGEAAFERRVDAGDGLVNALDGAADDAATVHARMPFGTFDQVELELDGDQWRITGGVADLYGRSTPRDCYRALVRALDARDASALWELMPGVFRAEVQRSDLEQWLEDEADAVQETVELLALAADAPLQEVGDRATLRYGDRLLELRREAGGWVVWDFD